MTRIDELNHPANDIALMSMDNATQILQKYGFMKINTVGANANIYAHANLSYVVKIFNTRDYCYEKFVHLVQNKPNVHYPKFRGKLMKITEEVMGIRMERLSPTTSQQEYDIVWQIGGLTSSRTYRFPNTLRERFPELETACDLVRNNRGTCVIDTGAPNVMFREDIPVIIDPWI